MSLRDCAACGRCLERDCYTRTQWSKGAGVSRCSGCVHQNHSSNNSSVVDPTRTARLNNANKASFSHDSLDDPFADGSFRWVAKGVYTEGDRAGELCVCKWFKTGGVMEEHFYDTDLSASNQAVVLVTKWNAERIVDRMIKINLPEVWTFEENCRGDWAGQKVLQEPFIEGYQKFNSNTGWSDDTLPWPRVMQALSHFTYHISDGQHLLCDLQGGIYSDGAVLTDPVVMSVLQEYGPTDLGTNGISTFFAHHQCNEFCRSHWRKPRNTTAYYSRTAGTTMVHVPTRNSRAPLSRAQY